MEQGPAGKAELRRDPLSTTWISVAPARIRRPVEGKGAASGACPFCPGHEELTPPEQASWRNSKEEGRWLVRVVTNLFPALSPLPPRDTLGQEAGEHRRDALGPGAEEDRLYVSLPARGAHEVIVEHPDHDADWCSLGEDHLALVLRAWQDRYRHHAQDPAVKYVQLFKNAGATAGASLHHPHSQLVALPLVPLLAERELQQAAAYSAATGKCLLCDMAGQEEGGPRLVAANRHFLAFCPFASRVSYETWVVPRRHEPDFGRLSPSELGSLAQILHALATAQHRVNRGDAFNLILRTAPCHGSYPHYHCRLEWLPRGGTAGGFEWGTGWFINPVTPEAAADRLRSQIPRRPLPGRSGIQDGAG